MTLLVVAKVKATGAQDRPTVAATLQRGTSSLKVRITVEGLASKQYVHVLVQGLNASTALSGNSATFAHDSSARKRGYYFTQNVYASRVGPNAHGDVNLTFEVPVATGIYDKLDVLGEILDAGDREIQVFQCDSRTPRITCLELEMPTPAAAIDDAPVLKRQRLLDNCVAYLYAQTPKKAHEQDISDAQYTRVLDQCDATVPRSS